MAMAPFYRLWQDQWDYVIHLIDSTSLLVITWIELHYIYNYIGSKKQPDITRTWLELITNSMG